METLFISDLHLSPERPEKLVLFQELMRGRARFAAGLYILGDLFDQFWVGNDDVTPPNPAIVAELAAYANVNERLYIIRGNRDLMLDAAFQSISGCTVLPDRHVIELQGEKVLLSHGDVFCSRDRSYQRYRRFMESGFTRAVFPRLPYFLRIRLAHGLKPLFRNAAAKKTRDIIDVDQHTVEAAMRSAGVRQVIHGHTHRPARHDGAAGTRWVLGDWETRGWYLRATARQIELINFSIDQ